MKALGILVVLVLLTGCSSGSDDSGGGGDRKRPDTAAEAPASVIEGLPATAERAWSTRLDALQDPIPAGDVVIVPVAARGDEIDVVALDREDGEELWRRPLMVVNADVGAFLGDLVHESAGGETYVVMQQAPTGDRLRESAALPYLALDPRTGEVLARTRPVVAQFGAPSCADGHDACLRISPDEMFEDTRWVLGSWKLRPEKDVVPEGTNSLVNGSDLYTVYGPVEHYAVAKAIGRAGASSWRVPWQRVTGSRRWLLDDGNGLVDDEAGVAVVQLLPTTADSLVRRYERGETVRFDLADRRTAGMDLETGKVLWRHRGADLRCLDLTRWEVPVRCSFSGQRSYQQDRDPRLKAAHGWLEGYDPSTGKTTWRQELGPRAVRTLVLDVLKLDAQVDRVRDADDLAVVPTPDGPTMLSLIDGSSRAVGAAEPLLCTGSVPHRHRFDAPNTAVRGFRDSRERGFVEPCSPTGKALGRSAEERVGAVAILTGAVDAGDGVHVLATRHAIQGYRLS